MGDGLMNIKFWGVRGSIPAPMTSKELREKQFELVRHTAKYIERQDLDNSSTLTDDAINAILDSMPRLTSTYGGNTTCVEVQGYNSPLSIIDAGTGIRTLGGNMMGRIFGPGNINPLDSNSKKSADDNVHLWFTHYHWDHIQGIPFFVPMFLPSKVSPKFIFYGKDNVKESIEDVLKGQQQFPNFPVIWDDLDCNRCYENLKRLHPKSKELGHTIVTYAELDHPDSALGYRFETKLDDKVVVYAHVCDTEDRRIRIPSAIKLAKNADVLYYDAQYSPADYAGVAGSVTGNFPKVGWGHSTYEAAIDVALEAGVRILVLGHHDPARTDKLLDLLFDEASIYRDKLVSEGEHNGKQLEVVMAKEGLEYKL